MITAHQSMEVMEFSQRGIIVSRCIGLGAVEIASFQLLFGQRQKWRVQPLSDFLRLAYSSTHSLCKRMHDSGLTRSTSDGVSATPFGIKIFQQTQFDAIKIMSGIQVGFSLETKTLIQQQPAKSSLYKWTRFANSVSFESPKHNELLLEIYNLHTRE